MNTDDLRRVLAEHEHLAPGMTGMIGRIREGARRRTRHRRRATATSAVAAVVAIGLAVPLTLTNSGSGRPVGNPPTAPPSDRPDDAEKLELIASVDDAPAPDPEVLTSRVTPDVAGQIISLSGDIVVHVSGDDGGGQTDPADATRHGWEPVELPVGTGYVKRDADSQVPGQFHLTWKYAPGRWADALGPDLDALVDLTPRLHATSPRLMRFPFRLAYLPGDPAIAFGLEGTVANGTVSRVVFTTGARTIQCDTGLPGVTPTGPRAESTTSPTRSCAVGPPTLFCDPPKADSSGGDPSTSSGPCAYPADAADRVIIEVSRGLPTDLSTARTDRDKRRISGPNRAGLAVERDDWVVSVTTPLGPERVSDFELERVVAGLTVLPVDDRSAWTDDPLP